LLLDTRDSEDAAQPQLPLSAWEDPESETLPPNGDEPPASTYRHLAGPFVGRFQERGSLADRDLLDAIVSSLSFSVWQGQQILVASEMRVPATVPLQQDSSMQAISAAAAEAQQAGTSAIVAVPGEAQRALPAAIGDDTGKGAVVSLPDRGVTRGVRPKQVDVRKLFEEAIGLEDHFCIVSLVHTTTEDLREDVLRAIVYYPKTCRQVEACLAHPMTSDRLRIVAEAAELDPEEAFCVSIVVEEIVYPPSFCMRVTSISLKDTDHISPDYAGKPHSHVYRVTKDGSSALSIPDVSFAVSNSTIRSKLLRCIGLSSHIQGPRETSIALPAAKDVTGKDSDSLVPIRVTGIATERGGLSLKLVDPKKRALTGVAGACLQNLHADKAPAALPAATRAHLREKYGKGKLLVRHGRLLGFEGADKGHAIRAIISVYERSQPYQHFVACAYEPQTSREWEVVADSIDIFKLFGDRDENRSQALDLGNPATREKLANVLAECVVLATREDEYVLIVSPSMVRAHVGKQIKEERAKQKAVRDRSLEPEVTGGERNGDVKVGGGRTTYALEIQPAVTSIQARAVGGFNGGYDRAEDVFVPQRAKDRLFVAQRRLATSKSKGQGDLFKICIYDAPLSTTLHSYILVATPVDSAPLGAAGLPTAILADQSGPAPERTEQRTYTLKIDDRLLDDFLWDRKLLEPSRQEELLSYISWNLHLDEDRDGQLRLNVRKKTLRTHQLPDALAQIHETGGKAPSAHMGDSALVSKRSGDPKLREVGGIFLLNELKTLNAVARKGTAAKKGLHGPSIRGRDTTSGVPRSLFHEGFKKIHCMAQRFGTSMCMITVSKMMNTYRLSVYEPESSGLYEMSLVTQNSSTPQSILIERCDLGAKLDLALCMNENAFPHHVALSLVHLPSGQEWNVQVGDDQVYTMLESSRRDIFMLYVDQLVTWGCIGYHVPPGTEEQALSQVFEETFAGNQIFERAELEDDALSTHLVATVERGELKTPAALELEAPKRIRVPVIRTQLDFLGKKTAPPAGVTMHLLYHAETKVDKDGPMLLLRVHKRVSSNDVAVTLRIRREDGERSLPQVPEKSRSLRAVGGTAQGRPFDAPPLAAGEVAGSPPDEVTLWLQDKCSRAPYGVYAEFCEVPGCPRQLLLLITDEDSPRCIRIAVALAHLPFTVLFQVVLLETSESSARVEASMMAKSSSNRRVMQSTFQRAFGNKTGGNSAAASHVQSLEVADRHKGLRRKLDDIHKPPDEAELLRRKLDAYAEMEGPNEHLGIERGTGTGGPQADGMSGADESVDVAVLYMCTRTKIGRMMVFTVYRDIVGHNMYLRVVMHDTTTQKDSHLTLLHYTTQRLLSILHINRDMLEECRSIEPDRVKQERQQVRAELGKLIVDALYLVRAQGTEDQGEELDPLELPEEEEVQYELRMRDVMDPANAAQISARRFLLAEADNSSSSIAGPWGIRGNEGHMASVDSMASARSLGAEDDGALATAAALSAPKSLLDTKHEALVHKAEKDVSGRRVLVTFYNETVPEDNLRYSHNIRVVVACVQTLQVLCMQDFHEDKLQIVCNARGKSHLMSVTREQELVRELWGSMVLKHSGPNITGISLGGLEEATL